MSEELSSLEPLLRGRRVIPPELPFPIKSEVRYLVGYVDDPLFKEEVEKIMTKSFRCAGTLKNAGDVCVLSEEGSFNKDGGYSIVVKYMYLAEDLVVKNENKTDNS